MNEEFKDFDVILMPIHNDVKIIKENIDYLNNYETELKIRDYKPTVILSSLLIDLVMMLKVLVREKHKMFQYAKNSKHFKIIEGQAAILRVI